MNIEWRQKYHLMPPRGWLNDPNGLCFFRGEYHVFYQYSPDQVNGGLKYWGHYKSKDMLNWQDMGIFLKPDKAWKKNGVYSGSAIEKDGLLYILYTGNVKEYGDYDYVNEGRQHNTALAITRDCMNIEEDCLILKNKDYPADLTLHVRDPKVFEYENKYYMILGARTKEDNGRAEIFESEDLRKWRHINSIETEYKFGYMWECPDLFKLGETWFLVLSPQGVEHEKYSFQNEYSAGYFILEGDFRGKYKLGEYRELDTGFDFYAPQTFLKDGRRLGLAWFGMPDALYTSPTVEYGWQHCMTLMREYKNVDNKLCILPAREYESLFEDFKRLSMAGKFVFETSDKAYDIFLDEISGELKINFFDTVELRYVKDEFVLSFIDNAYGRGKRYTKLSELKKLRILIDASSLEIFINDGENNVNTRMYPKEYKKIDFDGKAKLIIRKYKI